MDWAVLLVGVASVIKLDGKEEMKIRNLSPFARSLSVWLVMMSCSSDTGRSRISSTFGRSLEVEVEVELAVLRGVRAILE